MLLDMVLAGIPPLLRPTLWDKFLIGDEGLRAANLYYERLTQQIEWDVESQQKGTPLCDIAKDLSRTFPSTMPKEQEYFAGEEGKGKLQRVLGAYSLHNPTVGYCQGMNIVAGSLLLVVGDESRVFRLFSRLMDVNMDYYTRSMCGCLRDARTLNDLLHYHEPELHQHITAHGVSLAHTTPPWFLCRYMRTPLPLEAGVCFWDLYFLLGDSMLFRMGLALIRANRAKILSTDSYEKMNELFVHHIGRADPTVVFADLRNQLVQENEVPAGESSFTDVLQSLRELHKVDVLEELRVLPRGRIRQLQKRTSFNEDQLKACWTSLLRPSPWQGIVTNAFQDPVHFQSAFIECVWKYRENSFIEQWRQNGLIVDVFTRVWDMFRELKVSRSALGPLCLFPRYTGLTPVSGTSYGLSPISSPSPTPLPSITSTSPTYLATPTTTATATSIPATRTTGPPLEISEINKPSLHWKQFLTGVELFVKCNRTTRLRVAFWFCDREAKGTLSKDDILTAVSMFDRMHNGNASTFAETELFSEMMFEKAARMKQGGGQVALDFETFSSLIVLHPQIGNFFNLLVAG